ncbi:tetratricopeptide repeat protein [Novosphingobium sp. YJ-S2-02]|uniref:Tetratricopeptide repeat protein n=1 Tax=Novosphingobium aureum TaxID=2792964 RepID=A0A931HB50_9SPHN|nr:tetratricopeptide repeat protein [Novosphingobium aureum]MBH0112577.1 tetratricopeptide repeat protein [Novosphingobium aureum]
MNRLRGGRIVGIALVLAMLPGCSGTLKFLGLKHDAKTEYRVRNSDPGPDLALGSATEQGRTALMAGRDQEAVTLFRVALASGEAPAPARNGLGVAYARLGQFDAAERAFRLAIAADPAKATYATNLDRLLGSALARRQRDAETRALAARAAASAKPVATSAQAEAPGPRLTRVSRGMVSIRSMPGDRAVATSGRLPQVAAREKPKTKADDASLEEDAAEQLVAAKAEPGARTVAFIGNNPAFQPLVRVELKGDANEARR